MTIISDKKRVIYSKIILMTGIGVSVLTFFFIGKEQSTIDALAFYCILNSALTLLAGFFLIYREIKFYNIISVILAISVLLSFFVSSHEGALISVTKSIGMMLSFVGMVFASPLLGFIWVPLFLINALYGAYSAISYWRGNTRYEFELENTKIV